MSFLGKRLSLQLYWPDFSTLNLVEQVRQVSDGIEFPSISDFDNRSEPGVPVNADIDISDTGLSIVYSQGPGLFSSRPVNGYYLEDVDGNVPSIIGVSVIDSVQSIGILDNAISFGEDWIFVNISGLTFSPGRGVYLDVVFEESSHNGYRPTADEIFKSELSANEKLVKGAEEAGMIRVMADFSKASYHLEKHENYIINDFSPFADAARDEVIAQGWQPLDFNFESKSGSFFYTNHDLDSKSGVIQTNGMSNGFYTNGNAAAFVARSDDAIVISFRGTNDNGDDNPTDSENYFYPDREDWDDAGHHYYELLLPLIHEFDKYISENGISKVYVTGHSLGGAMAINYMRTHPDDSKYQAITFAAPAFVSRTGITVTESDFHPDSRTTQIEISGDPVPMTWDVLSVLSDTNRPGDVIRFAGDKTLDGLISTDNHSIDFYRQITDSVDASIWKKILAEAKTEDQNVFIGGRKNGDNFIVDGRESGENIILDDGNDKLFGPDTGEYDFFYGGRGLDKLTGGVDKEFFYGGSGNDIIDGDFGIDNAIYSASRSNYTLQHNESLFSADQRIVTDHRTVSDNEGTDTLENIERLIFTDYGLAFDLDGSAGMVAKLIGAVFGAGSVANTSYVAIGLSYLDSGTSYEDLATLAIDAAGANSPEEIVTLLWTNVVGSPPTSDQAQPYIDMLNSGTSVGELGVRAADHSLNQANINLVGLAENGIVFDPLHYQPISG